ncbi:MAG: argininosuccinate lyase [Clostridia bacterium]|nr:argininosuccinate lyase [Clostridia bacterium]
MKLWEGRFKKSLDKTADEFNSSISFDKNLYFEDIEGSLAHAHMLCEQGIISKEDYSLIKQGLSKIAFEIHSGDLLIDEDAEDIHTFIEGELTNRIGDAGKRLHTARSRNDQVAVDLRLYLRKRLDEIINSLYKLVKTLAQRAIETKDYVMPSYTHLQRAQISVFGHHLLAYAEMFLRDIDRMKDAKKRMNISPLGSCALAGTTYNIDRFMTAKELGFDAPCNNSLDGVSDRDYVIEILSDFSILMMHLSRFSEEIILWCSKEFSFVEPDDAFSTGSSIMPQKKNPDIAELIRGKTGRVYGSLMTMLTVMKGLPLAYNKDMQEDKEAMADALKTAIQCLNAFEPMIKTLKINKDNLKKAALTGFINATDAADYLVKKDLPFRDAYKIVGELVAYCIDNEKTLDNLSIEEYKKFSDLFEKDIFDSVSLEKMISERTCFGAPAPDNVEKQANKILEGIKND